MKIVFSALAILFVFSMICVAIYFPQVTSMTSTERSVWLDGHPFLALLGLLGPFIAFFGLFGLARLFNG